MEVSVYLLRTWGWAGILMALILLCGVNFKLSDSQVVQLCPGQSAELSCMVALQDSILWNGTAFTDQCPRASEPDAIRVTRNDIDSDSDTNPTTTRCGRLVAVNRFVNTTDPNFPGQVNMAILSNLSFVINDTSLSENVNILCNVALQDTPQVNTTIILRDITPQNLSFDQSSSSQNFYWNVDDESISECNLDFTVTIMRVPPSGFSPLTIPTAEGGVYMACATLTLGNYEFFVSSTSGTVMARSSPYQFSVSNMPQPIAGVEINNIMCDSATITFATIRPCAKYTIVAELRDDSCREEKTRSVGNTLVYYFSDLEQGATYCVCAIILDPANNNITVCGIDLPNNGEFTTLAACSSSVSIPHFQFNFILVATFVLWIAFVL